MKIKPKKLTFSALAVYGLSIFFILLILFPLVYSISLSFMDLHQMYEVPPRIFPESPKHFSIVADYSEFAEKELETKVMQEGTLALFGMLSRIPEETVGYVEFYGTYKGKVIFHTESHTRQLQVLWISGLYRQTNLSKKGLLRENPYGDEDLYVQFLKRIGYEYNLEGIDVSRDSIHFSEKSLESKVSEILVSQMEMEGDITSASFKTRFVLALENYFYYNLQVKETYSDATGSMGSSKLLKEAGFLQFFANTVIVVLFALLTQITITPLTAYPLSKLFKKKISDMILLFFLGTNFIPFVVIMIPQYKLFQSWGMTNNYWGLLVPHLLPFGFYVFLYKSFFDKIPQSLFDAARMDGAYELFIFRHIIIPLSRPIFLLVGINTFLANVVDFFWAWLITDNPSLYTMNVALYNLSRLSISSSQTNMMMGLAMITSLPVVIIVILLAKKIKSVALTSGLD